MNVHEEISTHSLEVQGTHKTSLLFFSHTFCHCFPVFLFDRKLLIKTDKVKYYLLPSLPSPNPQCIMRWETHTDLLIFCCRNVQLKNFTFISSLPAFSNWLHCPYRRGSSQSRAEQGGLQWAAPPERDFYSTEQVRGLMGLWGGDVSAGWELCLF